MAIPHDYVERVYAGVLGKIIGVYLGRPVEGWSHERIMQELGEITYYAHDKLSLPLIVADDDISGTFTFLRALPDNDNRRDLSPRQIGQTWLNYLIEQKTVLWWGGLGNSTEHTAFLRLKHGIPAPHSGSIALNGQIVAEQIGAQIFIDGWGMVAPGDPVLAADFARRAASVSHDGVAIHGAQLIAAMEAQAFVERDINALLDVGLAVIPRDSLLATLIADIRTWHARYGDWRTTRACIEERYGNHIYGGNCHVVPNHALIILGLLYGNDDVQRSLMITTTAGWDTDCNAGNIGCLLGIKNGLAGLDAGPDWRGPVADRMLLPTADGGRAITDALTETYAVANIGMALQGATILAPKGAARFHFELPGSVQGFRAEENVEKPCGVTIENVLGHSRRGVRSLALRYSGVTVDHAARVATPTFISADAPHPAAYPVAASPSLYAGQTIRAGIETDAENSTAITCRLYIRAYGANDVLERIYGPQIRLQPGAHHTLSWRIADTGGEPIAEVGVEISPDGVAVADVHGTLYLDYLDWDGTPDTTFERPKSGGSMWRRAWVNGVDHYDDLWPEPYRAIQNRGTGLLITGTRAWRDYTVASRLRPHMAARAGIGACVQGMRRWYALLLCADGCARLVKALDGEHVLAETACVWELDRAYRLELSVRGRQLVAAIDGVEVFHVDDHDRPLLEGAIALVVDEGRLDVDEIAVRPVSSRHTASPTAVTHAGAEAVHQRSVGSSKESTHDTSPSC